MMDKDKDMKVSCGVSSRQVDRFGMFALGGLLIPPKSPLKRCYLYSLKRTPSPLIPQPFLPAGEREAGR
jgi:hypothetical protein